MLEIIYFYTGKTEHDVAKLLPDLVIINTEQKLTGQKMPNHKSTKLALLVIGSLNTSILRSQGSTVQE